MKIPFGEWLPDLSDTENPGATVATNVIPAVDGYRPLPSLQTYATALDAYGRNAIAVKNSSGQTYMYAGDATKLYGLGVAPVTTNILRFNSKAEPAGDAMALASVPTAGRWSADAIDHCKVYLSFWVKLPAADGANNWRGAGALVTEFTGGFDDGNIIFGVRFGYSTATALWTLWGDVHVATAAFGTGEAFVGKKYTFAGAATAKWKHVLIEYDSEEATRANRYKLYLNDVKVTHTELEVDADLNKGLADSTTGSTTPGAVDFVVGQFLSGISGTEVNSTTVLTAEPFITVASTSDVAGVWYKGISAGASVFDFDVTADRRYFISAALEYVDHQSVMGGQTATVWADNTKADWVTNGFTTISTVDDVVESGAITAS